MSHSTANTAFQILSTCIIAQIQLYMAAFNRTVTGENIDSLPLSLYGKCR